MPSFEQSQKQVNDSDSYGGSSYSKIYAIFNGPDGDPSPASRRNATHISLKTAEGYNASVRQTGPSGYRNIAGTDLSSIFFPFESVIGSGGNLPSFDQSVNSSGITPSGHYTPNILNLLPFQWNPLQSGIVQDSYVNPSGDGLKDTLSGNFYTGDIDRYRNTDITRGIGIRLPMMGVGWGYTTFGDPWPSGNVSSGVAPYENIPSGTRLFKGDYLKGYQVDPQDYVAAPIDLRYDTTNNVWTSPKPLLVQILDQSGVAPRMQYAASGWAYSWQEMQIGISGLIVIKPSGYFGKLNAYELNGIPVPYGTLTYLEKKYDNIYGFKYDFPIGRGKYKVLMLIDDVAPSRGVWDYPRFSADGF